MISHAGSGRATPKRIQKLSVLYLFSGAPWRADIAVCLHALVADFNSSPDLTFIIEPGIKEVASREGVAPTTCLTQSGVNVTWSWLRLSTSLYTHILATRIHDRCYLAFRVLAQYVTIFILEAT